MMREPPAPFSPLAAAMTSIRPQPHQNHHRDDDRKPPVCARSRPGGEQTTTAYAMIALRHVARRSQALDTRISQLEAEIRLPLREGEHGPAAKGVGPTMTNPSEPLRVDRLND